MAFFQSAPVLGNQFDDDRVLGGYLARVLGEEGLSRARGVLREMGELAGGSLYRLQLEDRLNEPTITHWDPWGHRIDRIEVTALWRDAARIASEMGVVATGYEREHQPNARVVQFALVYMFHASSDVYTCPLAMTDGAARTLLAHQSPLAEHALPRLLSRDPARAWTSGQWMTERTGGSDVGISEAVAKRTEEAGRETYRLYGTKWFTSATTSQMALTLARPEGNPPGGRGLALFYLEPWNADGSMNGIQVNRLKDKLGTRKVPTAELLLDGTIATPVAGLSGGVRAIVPMLNVTRTWNAICSVSDMRRAIALARDFARRRVAFGAPLSQKPLHLETLAGMQAELDACFLLAFFAVEQLGRAESGATTEDEQLLFRVTTPIAKATTAKAAVPVVSEALESFGGAGYVEDTGLPRMLRDVQVTPIWEGTTNVLALDAIRAIGADGGGLRVWRAEAARRVASASPSLAREAEAALAAIDRASAWAMTAAASGPNALEAGARGLLLTLGRSMALALLVEQATFSLARGDGRAAAAARRFLVNGVDRLGAQDATEAAALADDHALAGLAGVPS